MRPPVNVGEEYELLIEEVGSKGDGFGKINNYVVFVKGTKAGQKYKIVITKALDRVGFGDIVSESADEPVESKNVIDATIKPAKSTTKEPEGEYVEVTGEDKEILSDNSMQ